MYKAFKFRIYPTDIQKELINKHIGSCRLVYNLGLSVKTEAYTRNRKNISRFDLQKQLPELKEAYVFFKEVNSQSLQVALINLDTAYLNFFKGIGKFPRYKSKRRGSQSFTAPQKVRIVDGKMLLPKFKEPIKIKIHREIPGDIKSATITRTPTGKYFASLLLDTGEEFPAKAKITERTAVGVDLGIKDFAILSNGKKYENKQYLEKTQKRLAFVQRKYSKHKGRKTKKRLAVLHEKVANQRKDFLHKVSIDIIRENQTIVIENLNIKGMMKNHKLANAIGSASWGMFTDMLAYKADWYGVNLLRIGRFEPSSKLCSNCGTKNSELKLSDRKWICNNCGKKHDRDINAAINIKNMGLSHVSGADTENLKELPTLAGAMT